MEKVTFVLVGVGNKKVPSDIEKTNRVTQRTCRSTAKGGIFDQRGNRLDDSKNPVLLLNTE